MFSSRLYIDIWRAAEQMNLRVYEWFNADLSRWHCRVKGKGHRHRVTKRTCIKTMSSNGLKLGSFWGIIHEQVVKQTQFIMYSQAMMMIKFTQSYMMADVYAMGQNENQAMILVRNTYRIIWPIVLTI